jgi:hypothetical protein
METSKKRGEKEMIFIGLFVGGILGMATMSIFSVNAYTKGFNDGARIYDQD